MPELVGLGFTVSDARTRQRLQANVTIHGGDDLNFTAGTVGDGGDVGFVFANVGRGKGQIVLSKPGYVTRTIDCEFPTTPNLDYALEPVSAPQPTRAERLNVRANFCNILCSIGPMFTAFLPKADEQGLLDEWIRLQVEAGSTHLTFSPKASYHNYMGGGFDWLGQPDRFAALVKRISETAGANGKAITPILFLDEGGPDPVGRIDQYWPPMAEALRKAGVIDRCIIVPAWEPVAGDWTSGELSYALERIHNLFPESLLGWHGSPNRWCGSSNPVEPTDPWQGAESDFFKSFGGQYIDIVFYQAPANSVDAPLCDPAKDNCWLNRWDDGVVRVGAGLNGWRIIPICLAEGPAYSFIRGNSTPDQARAWATAGRNLAVSRGVTVSFMNGLPNE